MGNLCDSPEDTAKRQFDRKAMKASRTIDGAALNFTRGFNSSLGATTQFLNLTFEASGLPNLDQGKTKSDPMLVLFRDEKLVGMTEFITDNLNPKWIKGFDVEYDFARAQSYIAKVYDIDNPSKLNDLNLHEYMGQVTFNLSELVTHKDQQLEIPIENPDLPKPGTLTVFGKLQSQMDDDKVSRFKIKAQHKNPTKEELFIAINRYVSPGRYQRVYKTETISSPFEWNTIEIETDMLCNDKDND